MSKRSRCPGSASRQDRRPSKARGERDCWARAKAKKEKAMTTRPTLVLGATGKTGRRVVQRLTARGLPVRAGSRSARPPFDWEDRTTWAPALNGVHAVYVAYYPDVAVPGAADILGEFAKLAVDNGARRLVLLSGR